MDGMNGLQRLITSLRDKIGVNSLIASSYKLDPDRIGVYPGDGISSISGIDTYYLEPIINLKRHLELNGKEFRPDPDYVYDPMVFLRGEMPFQENKCDINIGNLTYKLLIPDNILMQVINHCNDIEIISNFNGNYKIVHPEKFDLVQRMMSSFPLYGNMVNYFEKAERKEVPILNGFNQFITCASSRLAQPALKQLIEYYPMVGADMAVLDIGCGIGEYIKQLSRLNPSLHCTGIERDPKVASIARMNMDKDKDKDIQIINHDFLEWAGTYEGDGYDYIFMNHIYHVIGEDLSKRLTDAAFSLTKKNGFFFNLEICGDFPKDNETVPILFDALMRFYYPQFGGKVFNRIEIENMMESSGYSLGLPVQLDFDTPNMVYFVGQKK